MQQNQRDGAELQPLLVCYCSPVTVLTARMTLSRSRRSASLCRSRPLLKASICLHWDPLWNAAFAASTALSTSGCSSHAQEKVRLQVRSWTTVLRPQQASSYRMGWWQNPNHLTRPSSFHSWIWTQACKLFWVCSRLINNIEVKGSKGFFRGNFMQLACL